jgi:hypothetical protein
VNTLRRLRHWIAHRLGWNWCRHWAEDDERGHLVRWGFQCIGCGKVTVVRECRPSREEFVEVERSG